MPKKTEYEWIVLILTRRLRKTSVWSCRNKKSRDELGIVKWYGAWRQYCYLPFPHTVYSAGCLQDISDFLTQVNAAHRTERAAVDAAIADGTIEVPGDTKTHMLHVRKVDAAPDTDGEEAR